MASSKTKAPKSEKSKPDDERRPSRLATELRELADRLEELAEDVEHRIVGAHTNGRNLDDAEGIAEAVGAALYPRQRKGWGRERRARMRLMEVLGLDLEDDAEIGLLAKMAAPSFDFSVSQLKAMSKAVKRRGGPRASKNDLTRDDVARLLGCDPVVLRSEWSEWNRRTLATKKRAKKKRDRPNV